MGVKNVSGNEIAELISSVNLQILEHYLTNTGN